MNLERLHVMQVKTLSTLDGAHRVLVKTTDDKGLEQLQEMIIRSENLLSAGEIEKQVLGQIRNLHAAAVDMSIGTFGFPDGEEAVAASAPPSSFSSTSLSTPRSPRLAWSTPRSFIWSGGSSSTAAERRITPAGHPLRLVVSQYKPGHGNHHRVKRPHTS